MPAHDGDQTRRGFVVQPGEGAPLPAAGGHLIAGASDTGGLLSLIHSSAPPADHVPPHVHEEVDECFFVLHGEYRVACGEEAFQAPAGAFVYLPRGIPHSVTAGPEGGTQLIMALPGGLEAFFADLAADTPPSDLATRHGLRFL